MDKNTVVEFARREEATDPLTEMLRKGARELIQQAVEAELATFLEGYWDRRLNDGRAAVVRNGHLPEREIQTGIGPVTVQIPKVRSKDGEPMTFRSALVPPYVRKTRSLEAALPWLYLKGVSTGEMEQALSALVGPDAKGLSASTVSRLKRQWADEYDAWCKRPLDKDRWVYIWADGIYSGLRSEESKLCALVVMGVNARGEKYFLAIGDGAMGFWAALERVYPSTRQQRCWVHKTANVLNRLPKASQPKAKKALQAIWHAETREDAEKAFDTFIRTYNAKYPKVAECLLKDHEELMSFFDFPAEHWQSIRTTNPIESTFGTIRHRTKRSKGCLSRSGMLHMMFKMGMCAEDRWRKLRGLEQLAKVITGVKFKDGEEVTALNQDAA